MENKYTIDALKQLTVAVAESANVVGEVFADGKVSLADITELRAMLTALQDFSAVPFASLLPEASDLTADEATALAAHFAKYFDVANDTIERTVEQGLGILLNIAVAVKQIKDMFSKVKPAA